MPGEPVGYRSGAEIPEFEGTMRGGVTLVVRELADLDAVGTLCAGKTLAQIHDEIRAALGERAESVAFDLGAYRGQGEGQLADPPPVEEGSPDDELRLAVWLARQVWSAQDDRQGEVSVAVTIADPGRGPRGPLRLCGRRPALAYCPGSLLATLIPLVTNALLRFLLRKVLRFLCQRFPILNVVSKGWYVLKTAAWAVSVFAAGGEDAGTALVDNIRKRAAKKARLGGLGRLDECDPAELQQAKGVVILLHGLFSTDVGTFDHLIERWVHVAGKAARVFPAVGWPHDTLAGIEENAEQLCDWIDRKLGVDGPPFAFVCHSRGGLLARQTAERLYRRHPRYEQRLLGCVTFGTPHLGASLARCPIEQAAATIYTLGAAAVVGLGNVSIVALSHILRYYDDGGSFEGVRNLRPAEGDNFLVRLQQAERYGASAGAERKLDLFAVGGDYARGTTRRLDALWWLVSWILGESGHDLVVPTTSSIPGADSAAARLLRCSHFGYFAPEQLGSALGGEAISYLSDRFNVARVIAEITLEEQRSKEDGAEKALRDWEWILESIRRGGHTG